MTTTTKAKANETTIALNNEAVEAIIDGQATVVAVEEKNEFEAMMEAPLETVEQTTETEEGIKMNADQKIKAAQAALKNINEEQAQAGFSWAAVVTSSAVTGIIVGARMATRNMIIADTEVVGEQDTLKPYSGVEIAARMAGAMLVSGGINAGLQKASKFVSGNQYNLFTATSAVAHGTALVDTLFGDSLVEMVGGLVAGKAEEAEVAETQFIEDEA